MTGYMDGDQDLYDVAVLVDELRHEDAQYRLNSMQKLGKIAQALGAERTREELIPFLVDSVDDDDEILTAMAEQLGNFAEYVGGNQYVYVLLAPLERLAHVEEMAVRDKTVASLNAVASQLPEEHILSHFVPMIQRLAARDWFTSRISAAGAIAAAYGRVPQDAQAQLAEVFRGLAEDDTPMVRRAACAHLSEVAAKMTGEAVQEIMVSLLKNLASDEQDSVRLLAVNNCVALSKILPKTVVTDNVLPFAIALSEDRSWRVRWSVANKFVELCDALGEEATKEELLRSYEALVDDVEAEVRTAAASAAVEVARRIPSSMVVDKIVPGVGKLSQDANEFVRAAIASVILGLAPLLGEEATVTHLLPMILRLLKDSESQVRLNIISRLEDVNEVIGVRLLSESLFPAIVGLAADTQWRVRLAIIEFMPLLGRQLGVEFFDEHLTDLCIQWLGDPVSSIRESAASNISELSQVFGTQWVSKKIIPELKKLQTNRSYLVRLTVVHVLQRLGEHADDALLTQTINPMLGKLAKDSIPNVRLNVGKAIEALAAKLVKNNMKSQVEIILDKMTGDVDADVRYYATGAKRALDA